MDGQAWIEIATVQPNVVNYTLTGLDPATRYWFRVRGHREGDNVFSGYSDPASCTTPAEQPPPAAPSDLACQVVAPAQIDLTWTNHSANVTRNQVERRANGGGWSEIAAVAGDTSAYSDTSVTSDTQYFYRVRAFREEDGKYSEYSNEADCTTAAP